MKVTLIACIAKNGIIGNKGKLPWHIPEEMKHFLQTVKKEPCICGRFTAYHLPKSFAINRMFVTLSSINSEINTLEEAIAKIDSLYYKQCFIIGGAKVYEEAFRKNLVDEMILSYLPNNYEGDCSFPIVDWNNWILQSKVRKEGFTVKTFNRVKV